MIVRWGCDHAPVDDAFVVLTSVPLPEYRVFVPDYELVHAYAHELDCYQIQNPGQVPVPVLLRFSVPDSDQVPVLVCALVLVPAHESGLVSVPVPVRILAYAPDLVLISSLLHSGMIVPVRGPVRVSD